MVTRRKFMKWLLELSAVGAFLIPGASGRAATKKKILINQFSIAGFQYYQGPSWLDWMKVGEAVTFEAEPGNPYDAFAVKILYRGQQVGYVPRSDNRHISRLLKHNVPLQGRIAGVNPQAPLWRQVQVQVWLIYS